VLSGKLSKKIAKQKAKAFLPTTQETLLNPKLLSCSESRTTFRNLKVTSQQVLECVFAIGYLGQYTGALHALHANNPAPPDVISRRWRALNKLVFSGTQERPQMESNP
jgi:hypothetical protein